MNEATKEVLIEWAWAGVTVVVGVIILLILVAVLKRALKKTKLEPLLQSFIISAAKVLGIIMIVIVALEKVGVNPSSFITVMGVTGAAVALAVKDTLANIAGGIMIIASHPFKAGDFVNIEGFEGYVEKINILRTTLRTYDNKEIEVPNSIISTQILTNYTAKDIRRVDMTFQVEQDVDIRKVEDLLKAVADSSVLIIDEPAPSFGVSSVLDGRVNIDFFAWCRTDEYWDAFYFMQETCNMALEEAGIKRAAQKVEMEISK